MKKFIVFSIVVIMFMGLAAGKASAAASGMSSLTPGAFGFNVGFGDSSLGANGVITVSGKYLALSDLAITGGVGLQASSGDLDARFFSTSVGVRKYFRTDDFAPFVEGKFSYVSERIDLKGVDTNTIDLSANFGAEYFLHRQFSVEGSVGLGLGRVDDKTTDTDYSYVGTHTVGVSANFYF